MTAQPAVAPRSDEDEIERLKEKLRLVEEELNDLTEERDRLQQEVNQYEVDSEKCVEVRRDQRTALEHGRAVIEAVDGGDAFTRIMNERAVDAITELLGDR